MPSRGLVLLAKDTFSAVTKVSFDNVFSNTYKQYKIVFDMVKNSATNRNIDMRLRASGTDNSSSQYNWQYIYGESTTVGASRSATASEWVNVVYGLANGAEKSITILEVHNPFQTANATANVGRGYKLGQADIGMDVSAYGMDVTTSYDGFSVYPTAETITGSITVYGLVQ